MLPFAHKIAFLLFAAVTLAIGLRGFYRVYRRIRRGSHDSDARFDHLPQRLWAALVTTLTQSRTFRRRPAISFFHSFIFYGFVFLHPGKHGGCSRGIRLLYHSIGQLAGHRLQPAGRSTQCTRPYRRGRAGDSPLSFAQPPRLYLQPANHAAPGCEAQPHSYRLAYRLESLFFSTSAAAR